MRPLKNEQQQQQEQSGAFHRHVHAPFDCVKFITMSIISVSESPLHATIVHDKLQTHAIKDEGDEGCECKPGLNTKGVVAVTILLVLLNLYVHICVTLFVHVLVTVLVFP